MSTPFDPELTELTTTPDTDVVVEIYKVGGGTLGRAYEGRWGYRISRGGHVLASGEDLHTGTPKTHEEAAVIVTDFLDQLTGGMSNDAPA